MMPFVTDNSDSIINKTMYDTQDKCAGVEQPKVNQNFGCSTAPPPIGLKPRYIHDEDRYFEVRTAIWRFLDNQKSIPVEWVQEYNELISRVK